MKILPTKIASILFTVLLLHRYFLIIPYVTCYYNIFLGQKIILFLGHCRCGHLTEPLVSIESACKCETVKWDWNVGCSARATSYLLCVWVLKLLRCNENVSNHVCSHTILCFIYFHNWLPPPNSSKINNKWQGEKWKKWEKPRAHSKKKMEFVKKG